MTSPSLFYREIELTQGQVALVDVEDYDMLMRNRWHASWSQTTRSYYAARDTSIGGVPVRYWMHLVILGIAKGGDHENHVTLDNRRFNLRPCSDAESRRNRKRPSHNTSGFKGVIWQTNKWRARIMVDKKSVSLGMYDNIVEAAQAYNVAAVKYHGAFANLNLIA